jgi:hypothetical protein
MSMHYHPESELLVRIDPRQLSAYPMDRFQFLALYSYDARHVRKDKKGRPIPSPKTGKPVMILDGKRPLANRWSTMDLPPSAAILKEAMDQNYNVGIRLTAAQLVFDVDNRHDGERGWRNLCADFGLEEEAFPKVITGSGSSHFYCSKPPAIKIVGSLDHIDDVKPDKEKGIDGYRRYAGVEFKSVGQQVVAAGSIHPETKKHYVWDTLHPPVKRMPSCPDHLLEAITRSEVDYAMTGGGNITPEQLQSMLANLKPEDFASNEGWFKLAAACHHATAGEGREVFLDWSRGDPRYAHSGSIGTRWDSFDKKREAAITGRTLNKVLRDSGATDAQAVLESAADIAADFSPISAQEVDHIKAVARPDERVTANEDGPLPYWLRDAPPRQRFDMTELPLMLDYAEDAMLCAGEPLYQMGGRLVHPFRVAADDAGCDDVRRKRGALIVGDVPPPRLREYMIQSAPFYREVSTPNGHVKRVPHAAPLGLAVHFLARADKWNLPVLNGVIEAPTLRRDGTLLTVDGYDEDSGLLLDCQGVTFPEVDESPTRDDALAALANIKTLFEKFPFIDAASASVAFSAVLTALVRRSLRSAPLHATDAPTPGTGKTLCCQIPSLIATGRESTAMSQGANEEEDAKRLFAVLLRNDPTVLIDNVTRPIEGDALCTIMTEATWQSRFLGESRNVSVSTNALFMASGNNIVLAGDMTTRALKCRLDAKMERPETRRFDIDLKEHIPRNRPMLVAAGLTILRAFVVAERPGLAELEPFGRFEDWSNLVRGALVWLGEADPCDTRESIARDDPEKANHIALLQVMRTLSPRAYLASELIKLSKDGAVDADDLLLDAIQNAVPKVNARSLGNYLKSKDGRIVAGLQLTAQYNKKLKLWGYSVQSV